MVYHIPALLNESIDGLNIRPDGVYVDVTFGGGGHSMEILKRLEKGRLIAFDQDEDAEANIPTDDRILFLCQNFRFLRNNLRFAGINSIDGLIADLGVSFHQFDEPSRGFTFRSDAPLDMRMNKSGDITAEHLLNSLEEDKLADIFYNYAELQGSRRIAREIVAMRNRKRISTVNDIAQAVSHLVPPRQEHKFYAKLFQGLRIAVNHEMDYLREMLLQAQELLSSGGRLVVISYHSLEDRIVKNFMRTGNFEGEENKDFYGNVSTPFRVISRKGITPSDDEIDTNRRSRSARLRIAEKI
jgi:16S rRNA (cytosine1402-N4)-methyltransferase